LTSPFVSGLTAEHRGQIGAPAGSRALTCWKQVVFRLAPFRDRPDIPGLGKGFRISQATAYRYIDEAITDSAVPAPGAEKAREPDLPYLIMDGTIVASDRCAEKAISKNGLSTLTRK
jgi:hypothetical protein